jgi:hypothetical protein
VGNVKVEFGDLTVYGLRDLPKTDLAGAQQVPCVYFLVLDREVFYVGQTSNLALRLKGHLRPGGKLSPTALASIDIVHDFDELSSKLTIFWQPEPDLVRRLRLETIYVMRDLPRLNQALQLRIHGKKVTEIRWRKVGRLSRQKAGGGVKKKKAARKKSK